MTKSHQLLKADIINVYWNELEVLQPLLKQRFPDAIKVKWYSNGYRLFDHAVNNASIWVSGEKATENPKASIWDSGSGFVPKARFSIKFFEEFQEFESVDAFIQHERVRLVLER